MVANVVAERKAHKDAYLYESVRPGGEDVGYYLGWLNNLINFHFESFRCINHDTVYIL